MQDRILKKDKKLLLSFARKASKIGSCLLLDTEALTPVNFEEEKEKFFKSKTYSPQYVYEKKDFKNTSKQISSLIKQAEKFYIPRDLKKYLLEYANNLKALLFVFETIGTKYFANAAEQLIDWDEDEIKNGHKLLPEMIYAEDGLDFQNAPSIKKLFAQTIEKYGIKNYPVVIDSFNGHIIRDEPNKLIVGSKVKRTKNNVKRLIVHEVESHALQRYNLKLLDNQLLNLITFKDEVLYSEGLAVHNEIRTKTITKNALNTYIARLTAVELKNESFRKIFNILKKSIPDENAFITTYRLKRGLSNTQFPGGFTKDAAYLLGYGTVSSFLTSGGRIEDLYLFRVPCLCKLLTKYDLLESQDFKLPKFVSNPKHEPNI